MEIRIKALKFEASEKLLAFVEKKVARIEKFFDSATQVAEVSLEDSKEGKKAKLKVHIPGDDLVIECVSDTFENAITACVDALKAKLTRSKEKALGK